MINERLFGRPGAPSNWVFPVNDDGTMGEIKFANWRARGINDNFDLLADICNPGNIDLQTKWKNIAVEYKTTIKALQQKDEFSDAEIDNF